MKPNGLNDANTMEDIAGGFLCLQIDLDAIASGRIIESTILESFEILDVRLKDKIARTRNKQVLSWFSIGYEIFTCAWESVRNGSSDLKVISEKIKHSHDMFISGNKVNRRNVNFTINLDGYVQHCKPLSRSDEEDRNSPSP